MEFSLTVEASVTLPTVKMSKFCMGKSSKQAYRKLFKYFRSNALKQSKIGFGMKRIMSDIWTGKPFMKKTLVKFAIIFVAFLMVMVYLFFILVNTGIVGMVLISIYALIAFLYFGVHYLSKRAFTYHITDRTVRIEKSWIFGNYVRELTFDQISDIRINQGFLARMFNCGSLVFVTTTGLEVGASFGGGGIVRGGIFGGGGGVTPHVVKGRGNTLWDIADPGKARETLMGKLTEWRSAYQQQRMAGSLETMAGKAAPASAASMAEEISKLKALYESGGITKEEYEKAKKKLLG
jgi:membrane protein YdbS with pleckstrin-like domain